MAAVGDLVTALSIALGFVALLLWDGWRRKLGIDIRAQESKQKAGAAAAEALIARIARLEAAPPKMGAAELIEVNQRIDVLTKALEASVNEMRTLVAPLRVELERVNPKLFRVG